MTFTATPSAAYVEALATLEYLQGCLDAGATLCEVERAARIELNHLALCGDVETATALESMLVSRGLFA